MVDGPDGIVLSAFTRGVFATGKLFDSRFPLRVTVRDGQIERYHLLENSLDAAQAFALPA